MNMVFYLLAFLVCVCMYMAVRSSKSRREDMPLETVNKFKEFTDKDLFQELNNNENSIDDIKFIFQEISERNLWYIPVLVNKGKKHDDCKQVQRQKRSMDKKEFVKSKKYQGGMY